MLPSRVEKPVGKVTIPCNPTSLEAVTVEPLSVPSENFCINGTTTATNSYYLRFCVRRLSSVNVRQTRGRGSCSDLGMTSMCVNMPILCFHPVMVFLREILNNSSSTESEYELFNMVSSILSRISADKEYFVVAAVTCIYSTVYLWF